MPEGETYLNLGIALGLGLLVGLQRERAASALAGIRTFALITLLGAVCGLLATPLGGWVVGAGLVSIAALAWVGNALRPPSDEPPGLTTEVAMLLMFVVGAMVTMGPRTAGVMTGAACAVLLQLKPPLRRFTRVLTDADLRAIMQFAAMTLIILPVVPDRTFGPYDAFNPRHVWLMVVLVVGMSLAGYLAYRVLGQRTGTLLAGLVGGLVSSTATTVSFAKRAKSQPGTAGAAALAILLASCVLYVRLMVEVSAVAPRVSGTILGAIAVPLVATLAVAGWAFLRGKSERAEAPALSNPAELSSALVFAGIFAVVQFAAAFGADRFGQTGTYAVAAISGLTDMDAITLSVARMAQSGQVTPEAAAKAIAVGALSNTVFKTAVVGWLGGVAMLRRIGWMMGVSAAACVAVVVVW
jgi:uncharacterized membrane protein (DUF4010 family)